MQRRSFLAAFGVSALGAQTPAAAWLFERFHCRLAEISYRPPALWLEAIAAPRLPQVLAIRPDDRAPAVPEQFSLISDPSHRNHVFELREYETSTLSQLSQLRAYLITPRIGLFARCGLQPILCAQVVKNRKIPGLVCLLAYRTLADRERAWSTLSAAKEWTRLRKEVSPRVTAISLYRAAPAGGADFF